MKLVPSFLRVRIRHELIWMLSLACVSAGVLTLSGCSEKADAPAAEAETDKLWLTDFPAAQAMAAKEKKLLLMDFTGSDWCGWCIQLTKEVFSTPEFKEYATRNLVLLEVDFPQKKKQSKEQAAANDALQKKFKIEGYPTIIVLNGDGQKVGELGYEPGGPKAFIAQLEKLKK